jgi:hypothetical protein
MIVVSSHGLLTVMISPMHLSIQLHEAIQFCVVQVHTCCLKAFPMKVSMLHSSSSMYNSRCPGAILMTSFLTSVYTFTYCLYQWSLLSVGCIRPVTSLHSKNTVPQTSNTMTSHAQH